MTDKIRKSLKERCKLAKCFNKNGQRKIDHDKVLEKSEECTKQILETKKNYILKMTKKLTDSNNSPKTYWTILNCLLYNKKLPTVLPLLVKGKLAPDFCKKTNIFNNFFASVCTPTYNTSCLPSFSYKKESRIKFQCLQLSAQKYLTVNTFGIWGRIFVSLENIFYFKYSQTTFHLVIRKKCYKIFLGCIFWAPIPFKWYQNTSPCGTGQSLILLLKIIFEHSL